MDRRTLLTAALGGVAASAGAPGEGPAVIVDRQLAAYNANDIDAFVATYAPDAEIFRPQQQAEPVMRGREAIRASYGPRFATPPGVRAEIRNRIVVGPLVTDQEHLPLKGQQAVAVYEVDGALIRRVWLFGPYPV
jgi:hypothetical protein